MTKAQNRLWHEKANHPPQQHLRRLRHAAAARAITKAEAIELQESQKKQGMSNAKKTIGTIGTRGTVAGFRPLIGEERWHREDFTAEMLEGGWRPLLGTERHKTGDEFFDVYVSPLWEPCTYDHAGFDTAIEYTCLYRTRRPLPPPEVETFEAHGYVWYRHVHGDACPVEPNVAVECILRREIDGSFKPCVDKASVWNWTWGTSCGWDVIGYRFPDFTAVHTPLQQQQPIVQPVEKTEQLSQQGTTKKQLLTMYHGWCDVAPDSVDECITDVAKVLYPTDAERCEAAFEAWWFSYPEVQRRMIGCRVAWREAWKTKQEKL